MIITISGDPGSGKTTVGRNVAKALGFAHYSGGDMRGLVAKERGITIDELNKIGESDPSTDRDTDQKIAQLGKTKDNFVIDSRLAWHFIPHSIKIYLAVDIAIAARRVWHDVQVGDTDRSDETTYKNVKDVEKHLRQRTESDKKRYIKHYGLDHTDPSHYNLVLDTGKLTQDSVEEKILAFVQSFK